MLINCATFCVDELLWMLSWGWYQLVLGILFTWLLQVFVGRMRMLPAAILTIGAYAFAMFVYFAFVAGVFINYFQWQFVPGEAPNVFSPLYASFFLGLIYSLLQLLFYYIIALWRTLNIFRLFIFSLLSNTIAAFVASYFIKVIF